MKKKTKKLLELGTLKRKVAKKNKGMQTVKEASEELLLLADKLKEVIGSFVI